MNRSVPEYRPSGCTGALAIVVAAVVVSFPIAFATDLPTALPLVMGVTIVFAFALGFPIFGVLRERTRPSPRSIVKGGFVAGAAGPALMTLFLGLQFAFGGATSGEGVMATTFSLLEIVAGFGIAGVVGALLAWALIVWLSPERAAPLNRAGRTGLIITFAAVAIALGAHLPDLYVDRSCHNPMRDGRMSISPVAWFDLRIPIRDWPDLSAELKAFAGAQHWSFRDTVPFNPDFPWFDASLCAQRGTLVETSYTPGTDNAVIVTIYQPQGGESWKGPVESLQMRLERRWPDSVSYRSDPSGIPAPPSPVGSRSSSRSRTTAPSS